MKRVGHEPHPAVIERRYSDFCFVYECILRSFHPSILGDFMFPKKVSMNYCLEERNYLMDKKIINSKV